jgi:hypothetical protein
MMNLGRHRRTRWWSEGTWISNSTFQLSEHTVNFEYLMAGFIACACLLKILVQQSSIGV